MTAWRNTWGINRMILSALLYSLAFSFSSAASLLFVSLVPLFISFEISKTVRIAMIKGAAFGALSGSGITWWIITAAHKQYDLSLLKSVLLFLLIVVLPMALIYMLFAIGYYYLFRDRRYPVLVIAGIPSLWITIDYCVSLLPIGVPWIFAGYAAAPLSTFIQVADIGGVYLLTFLVVYVNVAVFMVLKEICNIDSENGIDWKAIVHVKEALRKRVYLPIVALLILMILVLPYGISRHIQWGQHTQDLTGNGIESVVIQGNFTSQQRWQDNNIFQRIEVYRSLTENHINRNVTSLMVWPETVLNSSMISHEKLASMMSSLLSENSMLITGAVFRPSGKEVYNSAYVISGNRRIARYDKNILLPYAESSPLGVAVLDNYYTAPDFFNRGYTAPIVKTSNGTIGISICFEQVYPSYIRGSVDLGATLLVNISNDSWFGDTTQPVQHLNCSVIRAVEHRRYLVRAANSGYSAIINAAGDVTNVTGLFKRDVIRGSVQHVEARSIYTRYGDMVLYLALMVLLLILAVEAFKNK